MSEGSKDALVKWRDGVIQEVILGRYDIENRSIVVDFGDRVEDVPLTRFMKVRNIPE